MIGAMFDITERKRAEERQRLLAGELQHRVKNTLALVQAIASQTLRGANDVNEMREAFAARLISLGRAHDILTQANWTEAPIGEVAEGALSVHRQAEARASHPISGPNGAPLRQGRALAGAGAARARDQRRQVRSPLERAAWSTCAGSWCTRATGPASA